MEKGTYTKKIDYSKYQLSKYSLTFRDKKFAGTWGCGATSLSLLTSKPPEHYSKLNKFKAHYDDKFMVRELKKSGYEVIPLTISSLTDTELVINPINNRHLLLVSQMVLKNEATWLMIAGGEYVIHNFQIDILSNLEFINHPILSIYILFKKSLRLNNL